MRRFFNTFAVVISLILLSVYLYLASRIATGLFSALALAIPFLLTWSLPVIYFSLDRESKSLGDVAYQWSGFISMALLSYLFVYSVARDLFFVFCFVIGFHFPSVLVASSGSWTILILSLVTIGLGMRKALSQPQIKTISIPIENLPPALEGLKIVQVTDLHIGVIIGASYVKQVVASVLALKPDLVAFTGDVVDGAPNNLRSDIEPLRELAQKAPTYYVTGNHEYYWGGDEWMVEFKKLGIHVLANSNQTIEHNGAKLLVGGVVDYAASHYGQPKSHPDPAAAIEGGANADFKILLAHQPKIAEQAAQAGFDLQLSGHTHGGQFFPWTWVGRFFHKFYLGLNQHQKLWIYISPGTGFWGPPVRLGSTAEISVLILHRKN